MTLDLATRPRVAIITNMPVHHQVDLFNEISGLGTVALRVYYLRRQSYGRFWVFPENIRHDAVFIRELRLQKHLYLSPGAFRAVLSWDPDILVICQYASVAMQTLMWSCSLLKRPWVFWSEPPSVMGALDDPIIRNRQLRRFFRRIALFPIKRWPMAIWGIGKTACRYYETLVKEVVNCEYFPYTSDLSAFLSIQRDARQRLPVRFLFSGSLTSRKGFDTLVCAVEELSKVTRDFQVFVVGRGPQEYLVSSLPDSIRRHFHLFGFRQRQEITRFYAECDVLVFPSRYDGWGMSVVEAMASGMPVIGSKTSGACTDLLEDNETGFLVQSGNPLELFSKMLEIIEKPLQIKTLGNEARKRAKPLDASVGAERFIKLLHLALK